VVLVPEGDKAEDLLGLFRLAHRGRAQRHVVFLERLADLVDRTVLLPERHREIEARETSRDCSRRDEYYSGDANSTAL